jgi:phospholipase/carboxylesterase
MKELITHPALPLTHRIREPQSGSIQGAPCLLLLHGVGANELSVEGIAAQIDPRFTVILVRSPLPFGPMQFGFFEVRFTPSGPQINPGQAEQSRQLLARFIEGLPEVYGIDPRQVWIAGFSQGGILSASVGLTRPDLVRGFGILSGRILPEITPKITMPQQLAGRTAVRTAFISHGVHDIKLTIDFARHAQKLLIEKNVALTYREYNAGHELNAAMLGDFTLWLAQELDEGGMRT